MSAADVAFLRSTHVGTTTSPLGISQWRRVAHSWLSERHPTVLICGRRKRRAAAVDDRRSRRRRIRRARRLLLNA